MYQICSGDRLGNVRIWRYKGAHAVTKQGLGFDLHYFDTTLAWSQYCRYNALWDSSSNSEHSKTDTGAKMEVAPGTKPLSLGHKSRVKVSTCCVCFRLYV
jgi:hypothetical protein